MAHNESSSVKADVLGSDEHLATTLCHLLEISSSRRMQIVGKIRCRPSERAPPGGVQTGRTHCELGKFIHPENFEDDKAIGLVASTP